MSEELLIGIRQIQNIKSKLKKLGLINVTEKSIKYVSQNNDTMSLNNDTKPLNNDTMSLNNDTKPLNNDTMSLNNDTMSLNNDTNPCNTDENQQVTEGKDIKNKKEIKKEKEIKDVADRNRSDESSDDSFLSDWVEDALKKKEEHLKKEKDNSCSVVDMVEGLRTNNPTEEKEDKQQIEEHPVFKTTIVSNMIEIIDSWIREIDKANISKTEKERLHKENSYNRLQLEKHLTNYLEGKDLKKLNENKEYFVNITENAFRSYKVKVHSEAVKASNKKNPYSDLEDSNTYRETDRWKK